MSDEAAAARAVADRLVGRYRAIAAGLGDLPIVNPRLGVEAVGFRPHRGWALGVVITPWFMNLAVAALAEDAPLPPAGPGESWSLPLPAGPVALTVGLLDGFGRVDAASLFSPMHAFPDPAVTRATAASVLTALFTPPAGAA
ncbi:[NiFe]-hydrogenase assembly chaperone HybE [Phaeospirillum tilakii]|uniref:[NiFe]-hydrogenase assembly chaperone HybE n=1 Tax=Phaeospirillum tilakii TaxID=741673 RepID=A0ABW5C5C0_9PROT